MSKSKKWLWIGIAISLLNPIFSGLILGAAYLTEPTLKKEGKIILTISVIWGAVFFVLVQNLDPQELFGAM